MSSSARWAILNVRSMSWLVLSFIGYSRPDAPIRGTGRLEGDARLGHCGRNRQKKLKTKARIAAICPYLPPFEKAGRIKNAGTWSPSPVTGPSGSGWRRSGAGLCAERGVLALSGGLMARSGGVLARSGGGEGARSPRGRADLRSPDFLP